ncbi:hypothetical protein ABWH92_07605 [Ahrensia marina]|uniref:hypothetical protein n=1 Tax=Ahrensia marina TaxID=1514904 RepID=UPI0035D0509C
MAVFALDSQPLIPASRLARYWTIIGSVLLAASVFQPIVASFLRDIPPEQMLAPMANYMGNGQMPDEVTNLFAGVFANIQFSLAFAALKLIVGGSVLFAALKLAKNDSTYAWILRATSYLGMAAFVGIGLYFAYSSFIIGSAMDIPLLMSIMMAAFGVVVAFFPGRWLWRNAESLRAL